MIPAEEGGAGEGAADPNTPEEPATPTAEELKAQMVAKYSQETIDAVCADADTNGWTEQDWEYQIWLYQHREEIEEVAGEEETPEETPDEEYIKNVMIVIYGPMMVSYVDIIEDTEGWTMQMWQAKIESYLLLYGELGTEMVALYGKEEVGEVRAAEDTSGWTREQWIAKLNENREKKEEEKEEDEAESGETSKIGYEYLDDQLGSLKDKVKINQYQSAESVNDWWEERGYKAPYKEKTVVQNITLTEDTKFVRVYDGVNSNLKGGWVMRAEDIKGLTPTEIQAKFALEYEPIFIGEVELKAGDTIRLGEVEPNFGFDGGGIQIDLQQQWIGEFTELGKIEDWR